MDNLLQPLPRYEGVIPNVFPSPFQHHPHPITLDAVSVLQRNLESNLIPAFENLHLDGKMFGVLVVSEPKTNTLSFLQAFSGQLAGSWTVEHFVPPLFDVHKLNLFWPQGQRELDQYSEHIDTLILLENELEKSLVSLDKVHRTKREFLSERLQERRFARRQRHQSGVSKERLDNESRDDSREKRELRATQKAERNVLAIDFDTTKQKRIELLRIRQQHSQALLMQIFALHKIEKGSGRSWNLADLCHEEMLPGGTGDCAGPKLIGYALKHGLTPVALAEFWWGAPPKTGGRYQGYFYPSCRGKCGKILPRMLRDMPVEPHPEFGNADIDEHWPKTVYEDSKLLIVEKPAGFLSVPGRGESKQDSVLARLQARYLKNEGPFLLHRLDLDTSGLLLAAKDQSTLSALARMMNERHIHKEYIAVVGGIVATQQGVIELPLRGDIDDRPRQIVDSIHGKPSKTWFSVISNESNTTRLRLVPHTGRTHQLRVHCSHHLGLNHPIDGDKLYGRNKNGRMKLHAARLRFRHPKTNRWVDVRSTPSF